MSELVLSTANSIPSAGLHYTARNESSPLPEDEETVGRVVAGETSFDSRIQPRVKSAGVLENAAPL